MLASAISVIGSGVAGDGMSSKKKGLTAADPRDQSKVESLRGELDDLVAAGCPLCEVCGQSAPRNATSSHSAA